MLEASGPIPFADGSGGAGGDEFDFAPPPAPEEAAPAPLAPPPVPLLPVAPPAAEPAAQAAPEAAPLAAPQAVPLAAPLAGPPSLVLEPSVPVPAAAPPPPPVAAQVLPPAPPPLLDPSTGQQPLQLPVLSAGLPEQPAAPASGGGLSPPGAGHGIPDPLPALAAPPSSGLDAGGPLPGDVPAEGQGGPAGYGEFGLGTSLQRPAWEVGGSDAGVGGAYGGSAEVPAPAARVSASGAGGYFSGEGMEPFVSGDRGSLEGGGGWGLSGAVHPAPFDAGLEAASGAGAFAVEAPPPLLPGGGYYAGGLGTGPQEAGPLSRGGASAVSVSSRGSQQQEKEDFSALQQHIDDLTTDKFQLQRALEAQRQALDRIQGEYDSLAAAKNDREASAESQLAEIRRLGEEVEARREDVERLLSERDGLRGTSYEAQERAQQLATEVIALEEDLLKARSGERQAERERKTFERNAVRQARELEQLRTLVEKLRCDRNARVNPKLAGGGGATLAPEAPQGEWDPASLPALAANLPPEVAETLGSVHRALDAMEAELGLATAITSGAAPPRP